MRILITELIWREGISALQSQGFDVDYDENLWKDRNQLLSKAADYDAIIVRNQTNFNDELLNASRNLKVIGRLGVGLDNISLQTAKNKGIKVISARHANATSVAEYVMAALLNTKRPLHLADSDIRNGNWDRKLFTGGELYGKVLGVVGLGEISHRVAKRAQAFGMRIIGFDPFITPYDHILSETGVELKSSLNEVLKIANYISLHLPLNKETKHLISRRELKIMNDDAYIINTSRGGIIDETALFEALEDREIKGAFLDVLEAEPISVRNKLLKSDYVTLTPHIAGLTEESQIRTSLLVGQEVAKSLKGEISLCTI